MSVIGQVESVSRYPVKSMRGEELPEIFVGFVARGHDGTTGVYGAVLAEGMIRPGDAVDTLD